jgi:hypothetical protein
MAEDTPKIIIDEDWKAQVEREKEEAKQASTSDEVPEKAAGEREEASFQGLVMSIGMQAMLSMGMIPVNEAKEVILDLDEAKYLIDSLLVLREKTKGNLTTEEQGFLTQTLADLQRVFVIRSQQLQEATIQGVDLRAQLRPME